MHTDLLHAEDRVFLRDVARFLERRGASELDRYLIWSTVEPDELSIDDLVEPSGWSRATLYRRRASLLVELAGFLLA